MTGLPPQGSGAKVSVSVSTFFVSILASPSSGLFPLAVSFSETIIDGTGPYTFSWIFGDGGTSTAANPNHVYVANGVFTVTLVVTDSTGAQATAITNVTALTGISTVAIGLGMTEGIGETETVGTYNGGPIVTDNLSEAETVGTYNGGPGLLESMGISEALIITNV